MQLFNAFPEDLMAFFGGDVDLFTPSGFYNWNSFLICQLSLGLWLYKPLQI
jgi:hypothetical protein